MKIKASHSPTLFLKELETKWQLLDGLLSFTTPLLLKGLSLPSAPPRRDAGTNLEVSPVTLKHLAQPLPHPPLYFVDMHYSLYSNASQSQQKTGP